mgnify:CR=1 FL=1
MNEQEFSLQIRRALNESAEKLPYRVTHRLAAAREAAIARAPAVRSARVALATGPTGSFDLDEPSLLWRWVGFLAPVLIVVAGLISIAFWDDVEKDQELADVDTAVLTDDVPISAYADRGFGVFLNNNRQ